MCTLPISQPKENLSFQSEIGSHFSPNSDNILTGDFNCVENPRLEHRSAASSTSTYIGGKELKDLAGGFGLVDK